MTMERPFSHVNAEGELRMVDVSDKAPTRRRAEASCRVVTSVDLAALPERADGLGARHAARVAGVLAAKRTDELIPLCHSLELSDVDVRVTPIEGGLAVAATVTATQRTGVEMEALTACAVAALSLIQAIGEVDPAAHVEGLALDAKEGGRSGAWGRHVPEGAEPGAP